jgi:hypothetical protein
VLTNVAKLAAAVRFGLSQSWTVSRCEPGTAPVARLGLANGTELPASGVFAGLGDASARPLAPATVPVTVAAAARPATSILNLDMVSSLP